MSRSFILIILAALVVAVTILPTTAPASGQALVTGATTQITIDVPSEGDRIGNGTETYIEIRTERQQFIRGAVRENQTDLGSYKQVNGVFFPFSISTGPKNRPDQKGTVTIEKMEANVAIPETEFKMPGAPAPAKSGAGKPGTQ